MGTPAFTLKGTGMPAPQPTATDLARFGSHAGEVARGRVCVIRDAADMRRDWPDCDNADIRARFFDIVNRTLDRMKRQGRPESEIEFYASMFRYLIDEVVPESK
jgi:hypothetical protein